MKLKIFVVLIVVVLTVAGGFYFVHRRDVQPELVSSGPGPGAGGSSGAGPDSFSVLNPAGGSGSVSNSTRSGEPVSRLDSEEMRRHHRREKGWLGILGSLGTLVALTGVIVTLGLWHQQRELQTKLALFDKRFSVFRRTDDFVNLALRVSGKFDIQKDYVPFLYAGEEAEFLFPRKSSVIVYLEGIRAKAMRLYALVNQRNEQTNPEWAENDKEIKELMIYFAGHAEGKKSAEAFRKYLQFD